MRGGKYRGSGGAILLVAILTLALSTLVFLAGVQTGAFVYTGGGWVVRIWNRMDRCLGGSILFFGVALIGYVACLLLLVREIGEYETVQGCDDPETDAPESQMVGGAEALAETVKKIRYYNAGLDLFITLFFAIGVLFTAWGMQNALVSTLGGVGKAAGGWGILQRLVENGILVALWTSIVGGAGGYLMRMVKLLFLGQTLNRFTACVQASERDAVLAALEAIRVKWPGSKRHGGSYPNGRSRMWGLSEDNLLSSLNNDCKTKTLQTDVKRFVAIVAFCLLGIFALVQSLPQTPVTNPSAIEDLSRQVAVVSAPEAEAMAAEKARLEALAKTLIPTAPAFPKPEVGEQKTMEGVSVTFASEEALMRLIAGGKVYLYIIIENLGTPFYVRINGGEMTFPGSPLPEDLDLWRLPEAQVPEAILRRFVQWTTLASRRKDFIVGLPADISRAIRGSGVKDVRFRINGDGTVTVSAR